MQGATNGADMDIKEPALNTMLKGHMKYMTSRQRVLAHNIANIDTPGYKARDLKKLDFGDMANRSISKLELRTTSQKHLEGTLAGANTPFRADKDRETFESSPTQNNVVLEDQMGKISDTGAQYSFSSSMLRKYTQLYRKATGGNQ
jgi:flagellar basal-body rod protein FlgB